MNKRPRIVVVGAGNVAYHLAPALCSVADVAQVCCKSIDHARELCCRLGQGQAIDKYSDMVTDADYYIVCVSDANINAVASSMPRVSGIVAHTSGSVAADVLNIASDNYGVLYPLQTFSKDVYVDISEVPFFTEASNDFSLDMLDKLAASLSQHKVTHIDSAQRGMLHLAAVFACNFTNLLWGVSGSIMHDIGCSLGDLAPLVRTTLAKAVANNPAEVQTGPASRGDIPVMAKQKNMLQSPWDDIYDALSSAIMQKRLNYPILKTK